MAEVGTEARVLGIGVLHPKPLLIHIVWVLESPFAVIEQISHALGATPALILVTNYWSILSRWKKDFAFKSFATGYSSHRRKHPNHQVVLLANDTTEVNFIRAHGIDTALFQHNGFLYARERAAEAEKEFDAIYIGRIRHNKRIELARDVASCCLVFASVDGNYYRKIRSQISHFVFANGEPEASATDNPFLGLTPLLTQAEVAAWCSRSRTGLILSAEEGANWASAEYMLAGLPVVSTRSLGGRDHYFDERFWFICEDDPSSVAEAVRAAISKKINPELIRSTFLARVIAERAALLQLLGSRTSEWGGTLEPFVRQWLNINTPFADRFHEFTAHELIGELTRASE